MKSKFIKILHYTLLISISFSSTFSARAMEDDGAGEQTMNFPVQQYISQIQLDEANTPFKSNHTVSQETSSLDILKNELNPYKLIWSSNYEFLKKFTKEDLVSLVNEALNKANNRTEYPVHLVFDEKSDSNRDIFEISDEINDWRNFYLKRFMLFTIYSRETTPKEVGTICFTLQRRINIDFELCVETKFRRREKEKPTEKPKKVAHLEYIEICPACRSNGYSNSALNIFHNFLDEIDTNFTYLHVASKKAYAGKIYKKVGYNFTPKVLEILKLWAGQKEFAVDQVEIEFLKDTTQSLKEFYGLNGFHGQLCMVRPHPNILTSPQF